jgi:Winged helix domain, variant/ATPase family associated with various cellular activities (AAA)
MTGDSGSAHLLRRLGSLLVRVRAVVDARRAADPSLDDPFLGLYVSEERAQRLLEGRHPTPASDEAAEIAASADADGRAEGSCLSRLTERFDLSPLDVELLVIALAPDVDARFEQLYGFCNDDVTLRRATIGLAADLLGAHPGDVDLRERFDDEAPLIRTGLIVVDQRDRPFLTRSLVVPDRVTAYLLGGTRPDPLVAGVLAAPAALVDDQANRLARVLGAGVRLIHLVDPVGRGPEVSAGAAELLDRPLLSVDLARVGGSQDLARVAHAAAREALLLGGLLHVGPIDVMVDRSNEPGEVVRCLAELDAPVIMSGVTSWDPRWARGVPLQIALDRRAATGPGWDQLVPDLADELTAAVEGQFQLRPGEVPRAVEAARMLAVWDGAELGAPHLRAGARQQNGARLERLARRLEPTVTWDDLVLPEQPRSALHRLADRARHRVTVLGEWGMRPGGGRGVGVTALLAGESGTGKTMSAEVLAGHLGLDLYVVNLATVVDKYVGETEKNLDRIFSDADSVNGVLLFDEADALFGSRSEVRDSHDRYANLEIAYLLQRMEAFDGLALLSTNLRANLDDAFARRLDATIEFPVPDAPLRRVLWEKILAPLTVADDVDLEFCSEAFELTGGNIRSAGITCGYAAAASDRIVTMTTVIRAVAEEYRKLGRLCLESEFGPYHHLTRP